MVRGALCDVRCARTAHSCVARRASRTPPPPCTTSPSPHGSSPAAPRLPRSAVQFESLDEDRQGSVSYHELCKALFPRQDWELLHEERSLAAVVRVQSHVRGFLVRARARRGIRSSAELMGSPAPPAIGVHPLNLGSTPALMSGAASSAAKFVAQALVGSPKATSWRDSPARAPLEELQRAASKGRSAATRPACEAAPFDAKRMEALEKAVQRLTQLTELLLADRQAQAPSARQPTAGGKLGEEEEHL